MKNTRFILAAVLVSVMIMTAGCRTAQVQPAAPAAPSVSTTPAPAASPAGTPVSPAASPESNPAVLVVYSPALVPDRTVGNILVVSLSIQNTGYDSFNTDPEYFSLRVNNAECPYYAEKSDLRSLVLPDGGKINGKLAFRVPQGTAAEAVKVDLEYNGTRPYNVQWLKK